MVCMDSLAWDCNGSLRSILVSILAIAELHGDWVMEEGMKPSVSRASFSSSGEYSPPYLIGLRKEVRGHGTLWDLFIKHSFI
ncbi:hypothetical protein CLU79DRAFT_449361 [Phycomyces nitens]|nr:hypothetical protein CLU79DRAFT_449361 [Phycomyces nitens]